MGSKSAKILSLLPLAAVTLTTSAWAADAPEEELKEVVVTGTSIRGVPPVGSAMISVGRDDIENSAASTTAELLRSLPQASLVGASEIVTNSGANLATLNVSRANGINLRGLGTQATLVLLDGHRPGKAGAGGQYFDPSVIPSLALSRIEVVADGASAIYGADAVAGVVNLILRDNFDGAEIAASRGSADEYRNEQASAIFGHRWTGGSFMVAGEYQYHNRVQALDRPDQFNSDQRDFGGRNQNLFLTTPGNLCPGNSCPPTPQYGIPAGQNGQGLTAASLSTTANQLSAFAGVSAIPEITRSSFVANVRQSITENLRLSADAFYTARDFEIDQGGVTRSVAVPSTNPFYIPLTGNTACPASLGVPAGTLCETVNYNFLNDLGTLTRNGHEMSGHYEAGLDYLFGSDFKLTSYVAHDRGRIYLKTEAVNAAAVNAAIRDTNPATALNVFGDGGDNNAATLANIAADFKQPSENILSIGSVKVDGPLFDMTGGKARFAVGAEYQREQFKNWTFRRDTTPSNTVVATPIDINPSREVTSGFAELFLPVVGAGNAMPGLLRLDLNAAVRYDDYSDFGSTTNPKFGVNYQPIESTTVHASYGTAFRAPTLADRTDAASATVLYFNNFGGSGLNVINPVGGNSTLVPEKAKTYSFGVDFTPAALPGFTANANWFRIDYKNIIDGPGAINPAVLFDPNYAFLVRRVSPATNATDLAYVNSILALPYAPVAPAAATSYNAVIDGRRQNVSASKTIGIDFTVAYKWTTDAAGTFNVGTSGTYLTKYAYTPVAGAATVDRLNYINFPLRFKARATLGWARAGLGANLYVNYTNGYTNNVVPLAGNVTGTVPVASYTTVDANLAYTFTDGASWLKDLTVSLSALDLFDEEPPRTLVGTYLFDGNVASPLNRMVTLELRKKF